MRIQALAGALILWSTVAQAEEPQPTDLGKTPSEEAKAEAPKAPPPAFAFALHGFVSSSLYLQDANLGPSEGQSALYVNAQSATLKQPSQDRLVFGGDVRQSRFNFSVTGPKESAFGATPKAVLEIDFFGNFGSGNYGDVSLTPRMRWAYAELDWGGGNRFLAGQNNDLIFTIAPASLAHIAFPYSYGAGNIGWRRPGIFGFHTIGDKKDTNFELAWEVGRSQWADAGGIGNGTVTPATAGVAGGDPYGFSLGESSGLPAVEARLMLASGSAWNLFTTGHWQRIDRSGVGNPVGTAAGTFPPGKDIDTIAMNVGGKATVGPLQLAAIGFTGKNLAPLIGNFLQFQANNIGDVHGMGGWVQAGYNFNKQLSLWGFIGAEKPNEAEAIAARFVRLSNVTSVGMLQYRDSTKVGGVSSDYAVAFEWVHMRTRTRVFASAASTAPGPNSGDLDGNQYIMSANYFF
ncbi:MAG TPA: hypothetical protein VF400_10815 [Anaeromyxobacteraceae bacterium]